MDILIYTLQLRILRYKVGNKSEKFKIPPYWPPPVCKDSLQLSVAWGVWIGISPDRARLSICSFSTVKMLFLKCTLEENSWRLKRRRIELWRLQQSQPCGYPVHSYDLLNLAMIEVRLKEAYACKMPRQSKGLLYNSTSQWSFLETSKRLVFTFCHAVLYSTDTPERIAVCYVKQTLFVKNNKYSIVDREIMHCGTHPKLGIYTFFACRLGTVLHATTIRVTAYSVDLCQECKTCNYFPTDCDYGSSANL